MAWPEATVGNKANQNSAANFREGGLRHRLPALVLIGGSVLALVLLPACLPFLGPNWFGNPPTTPAQGVQVAPKNKDNDATNERLNWILLYKYINDLLPRANGERLAITSRSRGEVRGIYFSKESGQAALKLLKKRRLDLAQQRTPTAQDARDDETIKRTLVSLNIEGILSLYADDLKPFADHLKEQNFDANQLDAARHGRQGSHQVDDRAR